MVRVDISPQILEWAAKRSGKSEDIHLKFKDWYKWINKESQPTLRQLESIAQTTATPLGYFFLTEPPVDKLPIPFFRTIDDQQVSIPSPELIETVQTMQRRQDWMREYLLEQGNGPLSFVGTKSFKDDPIQVAGEIRSFLGLESGWAAKCRTWEEALHMLFHKAEAANVLVVVNGVVGNNTHRKLNADEFRGFVLVDQYAPLIFVNGADYKAAQMFTVAHELAHIWYGASAAFDLKVLQPARDKIEQLCNIVAAEFLVSKDEFVEIWPNMNQSKNPFQDLARHFKVSEIVIARRALDLKLITKKEFFDFYNNRVTFYQKRPESTGGNFYDTQKYRIGHAFAEAVIRATLEGKILYNEAYRLTGIRGRTFSEFAARLGFGGNV